MEKKTREIRIEVMQMLYQYDFYQKDAVQYVPKTELEATLVLYESIIAVYDELSQIIENHLFDYRLARLSFVDRAILILATYELKYEEQGKEVVINEAIELTKQFSNLDDEKQHKFNNKVLDQIAQTIRGV